MHLGPDLEHKFLVDRAGARCVLRAADGRLALEVYEPARPVAYSRTMYLDTPDQRFLRSSEFRGRVRLRLRQYAAAPDLVAPPLVTSSTYLELKRTAGLARHKTRIALSAEDAAALVHGRISEPIAAQIAAQSLFDEVIEDLRNASLAPWATTWYRRMSLTGEGVRLTFDEAIAFCRPVLPALPGELAEPTGTVGRERRTIVEIKTRGAMPAWLAAVVAPFTPSLEYSKFRAAMAAVRASASKRDGTLPLPVLT